MPIRRKKRQQPAWDLYRDGISYSLLSRFINCRERFRIYAVEGLAPIDTTDYLEFGTIFHRLLEYHAKGYTFPQLERLLSKDGVSSDFLGRLALEIFRIYAATWKDQDSKIQYVSQEEVFRTTIYLPSGRKVYVYLGASAGGQVAYSFHSFKPVSNIHASGIADGVASFR